MEELVAQTEREVINFGESWKQANARRKREIQSALFPEGLVYDQNQFFLNRFNRTLVIDFTKEIDPQYVVDDCLSLIGVPIKHIFEHLDATIAEATPLYELCASVLKAAPPPDASP